MLDDEIVFVDESKADEFPRSVARQGDLVFTCWGTIGQIGLVDNRARFGRYIVSNKQMKLTPDQNIADSLFLYYALSSPEAVAQVQGMAIGSSVPGFNLTQLRQVAISCPPLYEQKAIAMALGALDDKIAVNDRIATTVEALLRNMYFARGMNSGEVRIGDIGFLVRESVKPDSLSGAEPYIGLEHMPRKQVWLSSWGRSSEVGSVKSAFESGDILFGKLRPYFHKVGMAQVNGVCSTDIIVVRASETKCRSWLLMALSSDEVVAHATARSDGTRMPRAKWADLADFKVPWPGAEQVACFEESAAPLIERAERGAAESRVLARLRDTLLPQLMCGKLRVRDAEKIVEDAV
ncbi:restriction endonuclease subunit S [Streptomyces sp. 029-5]|uniref:restriction endonuclease subunit S n=1 Tax=Streptomyces sp. 029-5 TaxID=2789261 RepID=UPI00397EFB87